MQHYYFYIAGTLLVLTALTSPSAYAGSAELTGSVHNNFTVKAEGGGNTAEAGEIITGETRSTVDIKTTVNGKVVEEIHETSTDGYLYVESTVVTDNNESFATTTIETEPPKVIPNASITSTFTDNDAEVATSPSTIITLTETSDESSTEFENTVEHTSFFTRLFSKISTTFTYVLSNIFS